MPRATQQCRDGKKQGEEAWMHMQDVGRPCDKTRIFGGGGGSGENEKHSSQITQSSEQEATDFRQQGAVEMRGLKSACTGEDLPWTNRYLLNNKF